ncbi:glycosyltransferase family A protein [Flavobacterium sp. DGU11]|uniref:Glycosyltransferase family A protein n=1 Tax=Flavobacterium arundinis TaxID=3139143 RepID=A0ABU9HVH5_9FLAO
MLSILIPTYNYNVLPLVSELYQQAQQSAIAFEILVFDDASPDKTSIAENQKINSVDHCRYELLESNIGRSAIRNLLAKKAKYSWLLFLDADTIPVTKNFISGYLPYLTDEEKVVYGSIKYQREKPAADKLLRWVYGNEREALPKEARDKDPYLSLLTLNFAISKSVFTKVKFNEEIPNLRYEDTLFSYDLMNAGVRIEHIANEVYHLGLDTSEIFVHKSEEATKGLKYLIDQKLIAADYIKIVKVYTRLKKFGLSPVLAMLHSAMNNAFRKNLVGSNPSLFIFDLYRLGYLCCLKK